jgi:hypothetical protein
MTPRITINGIALICLVLGCGLMVYLFAASRSDPSLRIAALVAGTSFVASLGAIASTILTGKDVTKHDPADLPPGGVSTESTTSTFQVPPVDPNAINVPKQ